MRTRSGGCLRGLGVPMRVDHEEIILRNAALTARVCWTLGQAFADRGDGSAPLLPHFVLAGGIVFHRATVTKISKMRFDSGLLKAVADRPDILAGIQTRMEDNVDSVLSGLQVGVASGLLTREGTPIGPSFRSLGTTLPKGIRDLEGQVDDILAAARRLGSWFADDSIETVVSRLRVEF